MKFLLGFFSLQWMRVFDFLAPLAIRLFLAPIFWVSGVKHLGLFSAANFVWYNPMTWIDPVTFQASVDALSNSFVFGMGAQTIVLTIGLIEVIGATLLIFGFAVRWAVLAMLFGMVVTAMLSLGGVPLVDTAKQFVMQHGYPSLQGTPVELYVTYFVLLLSLFFMGAGRWFSLDWYIYRHFARSIEQAELGQDDPFEIDATDQPGIRKAVR
ncbi:DoxX family protein [Thiolinea disciformis]|uniref:DoxX family protein n=1 Tax=Thiolinea disciformis TaxID=125614 RepID=UPI0003796C20|nr:DoxX family membrane protein [Thiolinea disciformis]